MLAAANRAQFQGVCGAYGGQVMLYSIVAVLGTNYVVTASIATPAGWATFTFVPATYTETNFLTDTSGYTVQAVITIQT